MSHDVASLELGHVLTNHKQKVVGEAMEGGSSNSTATGAKLTELEVLQKEHDEKSSKIQELKKQIVSTKQRLEKKKRSQSQGTKWKVSMH
ncbi:hypothetical protein P8452_31897 [Trifolium repens]|nr:hypothetical protein P8452_31897 [Trifolium repens]